MGYLLMAAPQGAQGGGSSLIGMLLPIVLVIIIVYFAIIRPLQKRQKERRSEQADLKTGVRIASSKLLRTWGIVIFLVGCAYGLYGLVPFLKAFYDQKLANSELTTLRAEIVALSKATVEFANRNQWTRSLDKRSDNPAWMDFVKKSQEHDQLVYAAERRRIELDRIVSKTERTIDRKQTPAILSALIVIAGLITFSMPRKAA